MKHYRELVSAMNRRKTLTVLVGLALIVVPSLVFAIVSAVNSGSASSATSSEPTYFAEVDKNGIVLRVIVIDQANIDTGKWGDPKNWIETKMDGSLHKNSAGIGYTYNKTLDAFIAPKPTPTAVLDPVKAQWVLPEAQTTFISSTSTQ